MNKALKLHINKCFCETDQFLEFWNEFETIIENIEI